MEGLKEPLEIKEGLWATMLSYGDVAAQYLSEIHDNSLSSFRIFCNTHTYLHPITQKY